MPRAPWPDGLPRSARSWRSPAGERFDQCIDLPDDRFAAMGIVAQDPGQIVPFQVSRPAAYRLRDVIIKRDDERDIVDIRCSQQLGYEAGNIEPVCMQSFPN